MSVESSKLSVLAFRRSDSRQLHLAPVRATMFTLGCCLLLARAQLVAISAGLSQPLGLNPNLAWRLQSGPLSSVVLCCLVIATRTLRVCRYERTLRTEASPCKANFPSLTGKPGMQECSRLTARPS